MFKNINFNKLYLTIFGINIFNYSTKCDFDNKIMCENIGKVLTGKEFKSKFPHYYAINRVRNNYKNEQKVNINSYFTDINYVKNNILFGNNIEIIELLDDSLIYIESLSNCKADKVIVQKIIYDNELNEIVKTFDNLRLLNMVKNDGTNISYIINPNKNIQLEAVKQNSFSIFFIDNPDKDVQLEAIKQDGLVIQYIKNPDKDVQLEAIKQNKLSIQYIKNPDKDVQLETVKQDGFIIRYIDNPDKDVQIQSIKQNGFAIQYIKNPDKNIIIKAIKQILLNIFM